MTGVSGNKTIPTLFIKLSRLALRVCLVLIALSTLLPRDVAHAADKKAAKKEKEAATTEEAQGSSKKKFSRVKEFICEADVYYTWKRRHYEDSETAGGEEIKGSEESGFYDPIEVFYVRAGERGAVELDVKNKLLTRISGVEASSLRTCQDRHQNLATCVARKLKGLADAYRLMDFSARRELMKATTSDCRNVSGFCISTRTGPIACFENRPPDLPPDEEEAEEIDDEVAPDAAKDAKKEETKKGKK